MPDPNEPLPLLNVFEVADEQAGTRHLLAFIEPVRAGSSGIDSRVIVGEVTPNAEGGYVATSLRLNPEFIEAFVAYMNEVIAVEPQIVEQARDQPSGWVYIIDPRHIEDSDRPTPASEVVGAFAVDESGQVVPRSFQYNANHALIDQERGMTGLFSDRRFYDWLHA